MPTNLMGTQLNLFANYTMIHTTCISIQHAANKLQNQLEKLLPWLKKMKNKLNANKKVAMKFRKHLKKINPINIKGNEIPWSSNTKYP